MLCPKAEVDQWTFGLLDQLNSFLDLFRIWGDGIRFDLGVGVRNINVRDLSPTEVLWNRDDSDAFFLVGFLNRFIDNFGQGTRSHHGTVKYGDIVENRFFIHCLEEVDVHILAWHLRNDRKDWDAIDFGIV